MFENAKLTSKIAGSIAGTLLFTSIAGSYITQHPINKQAEDGAQRARRTATLIPRYTLDQQQANPRA
jgi:hypothetical protein